MSKLRVSGRPVQATSVEVPELLCRGEMNVEQLSNEAQISIKLASAHLSVLKSACLVETRREGKNIFYSLASGDVAKFRVAIRFLAEERLLDLQSALGNLVSVPVILHNWTEENYYAMLKVANLLLSTYALPRNSWQGICLLPVPSHCQNSKNASPNYPGTNQSSLIVAVLFACLQAKP
jgi:DNA-binding transcriptional ArsR family regulator